MNAFQSQLFAMPLSPSSLPHRSLTRGHRPPTARWLAPLAAVSLLLASGCDRPTAPATTASAPKPAASSVSFTAQPIGGAIGRPPWIAHLTAVDLDKDGRLDILFCEAQDNEVRWLRQTAPGVFEKTGGANPKAEVGGKVEVFSLW